MARITFFGDVRGYSVGDDGRIWLSIDESDPSAEAKMYVHDMMKDFNPSSGRHGFGSRDVPCPVKPGFASYRVALSPDEAKDIVHGSVVELTIEVFFVRRVVFVAGRNGKPGRWAGIPEMYHEVIAVKPASSMHAIPNSTRPDKTPETAGAASGSTTGKNGK